MFYINYNDDILLLYQVSNSDGGWSKVTRIKINNNTYTKILDVHIGGFNLSNGLIEDHFIYIATIGNIAKLDINNSKFLWWHKDLYEKYKFNRFDDIEIINEKVYFTEENSSLKDFKRRKIVVNKYNGKIDVINEL